MKMGVAKALDVDESRIDIQFAGLNHMVFGLDVFLDGVSVKDKVIEAMADPENAMTMKNISGESWEPDFIRGLGLIPCGYHRYYYKTQEMLEHELEASKRKERVQRLFSKLKRNCLSCIKIRSWRSNRPSLKSAAAHITVMPPAT